MQLRYSRSSALGMALPLFWMATLAASATGGPDTQSAVKNRPAPFSNPASAVTMFHDYCSPCHGIGGRGDGPAAAALRQQPPDLTRLAARNEGVFPAARFQAVLEQGTVTAHGSSDMPVWGKVFSTMNDRAAALVRIRNLRQYVQRLQTP